MPEAGALHDRLTQLFAEHLHLEIPSPDIDLFETGALDSMAFVELLLRLEKEFGVRVLVEKLEIENFRSIGKIAAFIMAHDGLNGAGREPLQ